MPSFDVVSKVDLHELTNAVDQTNRDIDARFDFKGTSAKVEQDGHALTIIADGDFQVKQILEILYGKLAKRGIDVNALELGKIEEQGKGVKRPVSVRDGIDKDTGRRIVKLVKDSKLKVQAQIQDDQVRVSGKKRDDLQATMAALKGAGLELPLQFTNFRD